MAVSKWYERGIHQLDAEEPDFILVYLFQKETGCDSESASGGFVSLLETSPSVDVFQVDLSPQAIIYFLNAPRELCLGR